ncbi:MAG: helix-turn-helix transcriptional regulator [Clostridia bacterium]|nr:helix-turn-helix transcriptional regulator [Clostridia bacterium]
MKIAKNIKFFRLQLGLTQEKLANLLQGKKSLVSNYENGHSTPDIYILIKLADIFQVSLDELVGRDFK